jgi:hypothetical protein
MTRILLAGAAAFGLMIAGSPAGATAIGNCDIGPTAAFGGTGDISLAISGTTYFATACREPIANGNPTQETARLNTAFGTNFAYFDKTGEASATGLGITFTVTADLTKTGSWGVTWVDTAGTPNLPVDLIVGLFGGSNGAGYLLDNVVLTAGPTSGTGFFEIEFLNKNGTNTPALSHLTLIGGNFTSVPTPPTGVPEPMTLGLFGLGLLGMGVMSRRKLAA